MYIKRGGKGSHHTKMNDPGQKATLRERRAERLWLAIAVATLFLVSIGGEAEANLPASSLPPLDDEMSSSAQTKENPSIPEKQILLLKTNPTRFLSCFRRGFLRILASAIKGMPLPTGRFIPDFSPAPG
ncbi:hypothetical protein [Moorena bouillonii]|uniref:Uncharacterized protein n=1 Tax=Moorena bouillonii PNG TaxID=568701 RepID=A0A1U7MWI5_9CYAN|nr:hypothetical protein [Moorena bouillonii]OLT58055.1 hypothetical protein BJP37_02360 [Moorena bouillonii PNG]